ncbi:MAG TPA: hypothetical protein VGO75_10190, partial [Gemmatimonadaceae bacterium]|nr:hypothetical protein [Gemmatimonadaceae bacterium]
ARVTANGSTFQFKVNSATPPGQLTAGHAVYVNFRSGQVSTDGRKVCCQIVTDAATSSPKASSSEAITTVAAGIAAPGPVRDDNPACCVVTAMDLVSGVISARDPKTGYTFKFTVMRGMFSSNDSSRIVRNLTIGDSIWADLRGKGVKVDASKLCCVIVEESDH